MNNNSDEKKNWFKHAFAIPKDTPQYSAVEMQLINRLAGRIVQYGLTTFAIVMIDSSKPLNFLSSQLMYFFEPIVKAIFDWEDYSRFAKILEHRKSLEILLERIEYYEANYAELKELFLEDNHMKSLKDRVKDKIKSYLKKQ